MENISSGCGVVAGFASVVKVFQTESFFFYLSGLRYVPSTFNSADIFLQNNDCNRMLKRDKAALKICLLSNLKQRFFVVSGFFTRRNIPPQKFCLSNSCSPAI